MKAFEPNTKVVVNQQLKAVKDVVSGDFVETSTQPARVMIFPKTNREQFSEIIDYLVRVKLDRSNKLERSNKKLISFLSPETVSLRDIEQFIDFLVAQRKLIKR